MQISQIRMQSQQAKIAIQSRPATQSIQQSNANVQIEQPLAEMNIRTNPGKLTIDQSQAWEDMNIKSIFKRIEENAYQAEQVVMEGIARVVREGDEMLDIRSGRNIIVEQAKRKVNPPLAQTNITWVPSPFSVKAHYTRGNVDIQFEAKKPRIDVQTQKPIISYQRGDVHISMQQRNSLKIDFVK
ncbi:DUF6470 family protein [Bacillus sp. N9]